MTQRPGLDSRGPGERKRISVSSERLVRTSQLDGRHIPLVIEPAGPALRLAEWAGEQRASIRAELVRTGALLLRGFDVESVAAFEQFMRAVAGEPLPYIERSSPRTAVGGNVFTSTDYPPDRRIFLHTEQSYNATFPLAIAFHCIEPARIGGATPIADTRRVLARIPASIRETLRARSYMLARHYGAGLGLSWQVAFQCESRDDVERHCRAHGIETEWLTDGGLRTRQVRPVIARHPISGELAWFNHLTFFHTSTLDPDLRETLDEQAPDAALPTQTYYGDGAPFEPALLDALRDAYLREQIEFEWRRGDVLLLDNMLTAHGRAPYTGPRRVAVAMADPYDWAHAAA